jgi:hypothetical protein
VLQRLKDREMQLWMCGDEAIAVTEIMVMPDFKILAVPIIAGSNVAKWMPEFSDTMKEFGRIHDCKYIEGYGRKGWIKTMKEFGFKEYSITIRCEL